MSWSNCASWALICSPKRAARSCRSPRMSRIAAPRSWWWFQRPRAGWQVHARPNEPCLAAAPGKSCKVPACLGRAASLPSSNHKGRPPVSFGLRRGGGALRGSHRLSSNALPPRAGCSAKTGSSFPVDKKIAAVDCASLWPERPKARSAAGHGLRRTGARFGFAISGRNTASSPIAGRNAHTW